MDHLVQDAYLDAVRNALAPRFRVEREIGRGGTATVYLAYDSRYERDVAIKVLRPELAAAVWRDRFFREIRLTARLTHPNILQLLESDEVGGWLFYVMPYVRGESLRQRIRRERQLPLEDAIRITREVADALAAAHAQGVVHRDVKPENILFEAGHAVVADFGIAKAISEAAGERLTTTGLRIGTPGYMSPEQASGEENLDQRSDVYSLAAVLYEMLAGEPPYTGPTAQAIIAKQLSQPVPSLRVVRETVPPALEEVICRGLAKVPADRYSTVADFTTAAARSARSSRWVRWSLPAVPRPGWLPPEARPRGTVLALGGAAVVALAVAGVALLVPRSAGNGVASRVVDTASVRVAVLPPEIPDRSDQYLDRARLIQHLLATELSRRRGVAVVDPLSLNSRLDAAGLEPGADPIGILRSWGIRYVLRTTMVAASGRLEVSYLLTDTRQGQVVETGAFTNTDEAELPGQVRQAAGRLLDVLDVAIGGVSRALDMQPFLARAPANVAAVNAFLQGIDYSFRGLPGGRMHFERAVELDPDFIAPRIWLVSGLLEAGDTAAARVHVRVLQSLQPGATPFEQALIGWAEAGVRGDWEAKVRHLQVALGYSPRNNVLLFSLGFSLWILGRPEEALEPVREAMESGWRFPPLYTLWGVLAIEVGQLDGLRQTLEAARRVTPTEPYLAGLLEALALFEQDAEAARRYGASFRAALGGSGVGGALSEMVPVYRSLGRHARARGELETAASLLQWAVDAGPGQPIPRLELAQVLAESGNQRAAEDHYRAAARTESPTPDVVYLLGEVAVVLGHEADARRYLTQYLDVAPQGPDALQARERLNVLRRP